MLTKVSFWVSFCFIITTLLCALIVYYSLVQSKAKTTRAKSNIILIGIVAWLALQMVLGATGVYANYINAMPPYIFLFGVLPALIGMCYLFFSTKGKAFVQTLPLEYITNIHIVRIPVEFVLCCLFFENVLPKGMTFFGYNYDIIIGITAPIISFLHFKQKAVSRNTLLVWNCIGLLFLLHVVIIGILSAPISIQQLNFSHPNIAVLYFPFNWLITFIVPIVLFCHIASIVKLLQPSTNEVAIPTVSDFYKS
jgi:hypothetical protein